MYMANYVLLMLSLWVYLLYLCIHIILNVCSPLVLRVGCLHLHGGTNTQDEER